MAALWNTSSSSRTVGCQNVDAAFVLVRFYGEFSQLINQREYIS